MRRLYGFLILALVVIIGVLYVESDHPGMTSNGGDDSVYTVMLGDPRPPPPGLDGDGRPLELAPRSPASSGKDEDEDEDENGASSTNVQPAAALPSKSVPPGTPLNPDPPESYRYTVRSGDTLGKIVEAHLGSASPDRVERVRQQNKLSNTNQIRPGDVLIIPVVNPERHEANGKETLRDIAKLRLGRSSRVEALLKANPGLPTNQHGALPRGVVIWIPR